MANTATAKTPRRVDTHGVSSITPVVVTIDTPDEYLTVYTPGSDQQAAIFLIFYAEANPHTLTIASGNDDEVAPELPINSGIIHALFEGIIFISAPGQAIRIKSSAAITGPMLFYIGEAYRFKKD